MVFVLYSVILFAIVYFWPRTRIDRLLSKQDIRQLREFYTHISTNHSQKLDEGAKEILKRARRNMYSRRHYKQERGSLELVFLWNHIDVSKKYDELIVNIIRRHTNINPELSDGKHISAWFNKIMDRDNMRKNTAQKIRAWYIERKINHHIADVLSKLPDLNKREYAKNNPHIINLGLGGNCEWQIDMYASYKGMNVLAHYIYEDIEPTIVFGPWVTDAWMPKKLQYVLRHQMDVTSARLVYCHEMIHASDALLNTKGWGSGEEKTWIGEAVTDTLSHLLYAPERMETGNVGYQEARCAFAGLLAHFHGNEQTKLKTLWRMVSDAQSLHKELFDNCSLNHEGIRYGLIALMRGAHEGTDWAEWWKGAHELTLKANQE